MKRKLLKRRLRVREQLQTSFGQHVRCCPVAEKLLLKRQPNHLSDGLSMIGWCMWSIFFGLVGMTFSFSPSLLLNFHASPPYFQSHHSIIIFLNI
jgi:hypothetical protein